MKGLVEDLRSSSELLVNLTRREVKGKYKRTAIGQLWSLANPVASMIIFTVVFAFIIRVTVPPGDPSRLDVFALWLMCGLLPWTFFMAVVNGGMASLVANENLIKKVWFPRVTLVVSSTFAALFSWSIEMAVLVAAIVGTAAIGSALVVPALLWTIPVAALVMVLMALFATGVAMIFAILNVYFRDTQHLTSILFQAWFYLSPILYPTTYVVEQLERHETLSSVAPVVVRLYELNPIAAFAGVFRNLLYDGRLPSVGPVLVCVGWTILALVVGAAVFRRNEGRLAEVL